MKLSRRNLLLAGAASVLAGPAAAQMTLLGAGRGAAGAAAVPDTPWPFTWAINADLASIGSSTADDQASGGRSPGIMKHAHTDTTGGTYYDGDSGLPASGGVLLVADGVGNTTSAQIETKFLAASARLKASNIICQPGGNYETQQSPIPAIVQNMQDIVAGAGHSRFMFAPKHADNVAASGSIDWHRLRRLTRDLRALYPGRVQDVAIMFRDQNTGVGSDTTAQQRDEIPPSLAFDTAHANGAGNQLISRLCWQPWAHARSADRPLPFVPHQHVFSTAATNQTAGGFVADVEHDASIAGTLTGVTFTITNNAEFTVAVVGGVIKLYRATPAANLAAGYYKLYLRASKGGVSRVSILRVYLGALTGTGASRAFVNRQALVREGAIGGVSSVTKLSLAIGIRPLAGWDAEGSTTIRQFILFGGNRIDVSVKQSVPNLNLNVVMRANDGATQIYNLDTSTLAAQRFNEANGIQWLFVAVDWDAGVYNQAVGANTAQTTGWTMPTPGTQSLQIAVPVNNILNLLFTNGVTASGAGRSLNAEIVAVAMWNGYIDWTATSGGNRDKVRDPTSRASVLNSTRGGDAPGQVAGLTPFLWMEGPAGNWQQGLNLAAPSERWDCTDRDDLTMQTVAA